MYLENVSDYVSKINIKSEHSTRWVVRIGQIAKKIRYGAENPFNFLPGRSRRAEPVPRMYKSYSYAAVDPTTTPELGDTTV